MTKSLAADRCFEVDERVDMWIREGAVGIVDAPFKPGFIFVSIEFANVQHLLCGIDCKEYKKIELCDPG